MGRSDVRTQSPSFTRYCTSLGSTLSADAADHMTARVSLATAYESTTRATATDDADGQVPDNHRHDDAAPTLPLRSVARACSTYGTAADSPASDTTLLAKRCR
jgi:hypothetical protein